MDDSYPFYSMWISCPIPEICLFQTLTLKLQGQGHGCGQRARSCSQPSFLLICFLFISHQSGQQFLRYSYFEIWPWNIQGQSHELGQRSRSHIIPSIQPTHFVFVSHQSDQPFLRYVVIGWVALTLSCRQANLDKSMPQPRPWVKVMESSSSTFPQTYIFIVSEVAQTVLTWQAKVVAAADVSETKRNHKVTPDRGDLKMWTEGQRDGQHHSKSRLVEAKNISDNIDCSKRNFRVNTVLASGLASNSRR